MRILYVATDIPVPGTTGGSIHVRAVAEGLASLGHDVHVVAMPGTEGGFPTGAVRWHPLGPPLGLRQLRVLRTRQVIDLVRTIRPDVVMERYYNFGGEGLRAARRVGARTVLEVNAPVIDYPGSPKRWVDRALLVEPMRRWRDWQATAADLVVTPSAGILPASVSRERVVEIEWGADTDRFHPGATGPLPFRRPPDTTLAVFAGAFRRWHGAIHLVEAIDRIRSRGRRDVAAVLIGDGPELARVRRSAAGSDSVMLAGAVPHEQMPACLAAADVGVAPFDVAAHAPLALDFYWSPLKVFEYMAAGLPVVVPDIPRLRRIVTDEREGILYDASDPEALARALERLTDRARRRAIGSAARARVVAEFGWDIHCRKLDEAIKRIGDD